MLSSKSDKGEAKFATRLDVLVQRVDTLASTVASTASALAKKDGEIASLRKELDARDERLAAFVRQAREPAVNSELYELKQAVAALAAERAKGGGSAKGLDELTAKVNLLGQRIETVSTTVSTTAAGLAGRDGELAAIRKRLESAPPPGAVAADPALVRRIGDLAGDVTGTKLQLDTLSQEIAALRALAEAPQPQVSPALEERVGELTAEVNGTRSRLDELARQIVAVRTQAEQHAVESARPSEEIREMLTALRGKVEELGALGAAVTEEQLDERVGRTDESVTRLASRVEALTVTIDSAVADISAKEVELSELHRRFTESSGRIESVVDDIREALSAFPELGSANVDDLAARLERLGERVERSDAATRQHSETGQRLAAELSHKIEAIEAQVATVASEVARAKTLWPVALRSLEARLDDVAPHARQPEPVLATDTDPAGSRADDDLLAGLRDSLQAMETVAAEMSRASDALTAADAPFPIIPPAPAQEAVGAGGATIVPLRSSDP